MLWYLLTLSMSRSPRRIRSNRDNLPVLSNPVIITTELKPSNAFNTLWSCQGLSSTDCQTLRSLMVSQSDSINEAFQYVKDFGYSRPISRLSFNMGNTLIQVFCMLIDEEKPNGNLVVRIVAYHQPVSRVDSQIKDYVITHYNLKVIAKKDRHYAFAIIFS